MKNIGEKFCGIVRCFWFFAGSIALPGTALPSVTVSEITQLSFGMLEIPASGAADITVDCDNGTVAGSANLIHNSASNGQYLLSSTEPSEIVSIDIQNISTGSSALNLHHFKGRYRGQSIGSFPVENLTVPNNGAALNLGATLAFTAAVSEQPYVMHFDIVVNYE